MKKNRTSLGNGVHLACLERPGGDSSTTSSRTTGSTLSTAGSKALKSR